MQRLSNDEYYLSLLAGVAARGSCVRRQVGAIVVDENYRVLSMGFNGPPKGFPHCGEVDHVPPTNVPYGVWKAVHCQGATEQKGSTTKCMAVHAEINALLTCADPNRAHTIYVSCTPCRNCALAIVNTNIRRVVCLELYADDARHILNAGEIELIIRPR